jgi:hypothetical protein
MTSVLARKTPRAVCGDVLALPFAAVFEQILLPFQGLSELAEPGDRRRLFEEVARHLRGRFLCTAHNPRVRARTLDGEWRSVGTFPHGGGTIEVAVRGEVDDAIATGEQRLMVRNADGAIERDHRLPLRFSLPPLAEILDFARDAGLRAVSVLGGYDRSPYDEASSAAIIVEFEPATAS